MVAPAPSSAAAAALSCCCTLSMGVSVLRHPPKHHPQGWSQAFHTASVSYSPQLGNRTKGAKRLDPVAVLPLYTLGAVAQYELETFYNDWTLDEATLKNIYLVFSLFFVWGCCVFASMKDPFYDSDIYRGEGGDGTGNWLYKLEEEEEMNAREELWREELAREIEERVGELKELEETEKQKELV